VHIVGGPGSGKSVLGHQLALRLGLPLYPVEEIAYREGWHADFQLGRALAARQADVASIASQPTWVTEGTFLGWTEPLFVAADVIIWLDLPWRVAVWRILRRHVLGRCLDPDGRFSLSASVRHLAHPGLRQLRDFLRWSHRYYVRRDALWDAARVDDIHALSRAATAVYLSPWAGKVIHCQRAADVTRLVEAATATPVRLIPGTLVHSG
jgi:adenylate kinase family enzyme